MPTRSPLTVLFALLLAAAFASASASGQSAGPPGGSPPGLEQAIAVKERNAERLLDTPGIVGVGVGVNPAGKPVIHVYTETQGTPGVPGSLEGFDVQRVVTGVLQPRAPTDRFPRPVPIGVSSGHYDFATGTLGVRVTDGTNVYALSNNHVFAAVNGASIGDPILQPGPIEDGGTDPADRIGTLYDFQTINFDTGSTNTMDAAIALTSASLVGTSTPPDGYGAPSSVTTAAFSGQGVQKYGRTTGFQLGSVVDTSLSVDVCYVYLIFCWQEARFVNQISVSPGTFSAGGDSGSLIVEQGSNQPVALLFAGGDGLTIGSPIDTVLQRFGVTIDGAPLGDGPPSAPTALSALAGDGSVSLSWSPPTFDGGSPVTGYRVYRGTSPGAESFLADAGTSTSYVDGSAANGTTYYYKVSAENANGEGALSNEASATPSALVPPDEPLPTLDDFDRGSENPLSDGGRWSNAVNGGVENGLYVSSNELACSVTTTCTAWRNDSQYGPDSEAWVRLTTLAGTGNGLRLYVRVQQPGSTAIDGYMIRTSQGSTSDQIYLDRLDDGAIVNRLLVSQHLAVGDLLLLRAQGTTIEVWHRSGSTWSRLAAIQDSTYTSGGFVGVGLRGTSGRLDDFGARTMGASPPSAPTALSALAGDASVDLSWSPPTFDGGSPVTSYKVYRGTSPGAESFLADAGTSTSYTDSTAANGTTYSYKVSAVNANGEGALSNEASALPAPYVAPAEPLPILDAFERGFENPLSDAGRWSNGINGSGESGLYVPSVWLACSKTTTCTAWRNAAQYGPDTEVWTTVSTLPGTSNGIRLLARLQQVGTSTYDGYMLRTDELSGPDQIWLERVDNGVFVRLLTLSHELTAGDRLLLRATGSTLEIWHHDGSGWLRLGVVQDSTYSTAGYTGIGLRGTTGRLDDFGARTMGSPPPDTEPPTAPTALGAIAASPSQINLSWSAASDNVGVARYRIERCAGASCSSFTEIGTSTSTSYADTTVAPSSAYSYRARAEDAAGNRSGYSNTASATTPTPPDTEPPTAPTALGAIAASPSQINLSWSAASDNVGVALYRIERCAGASCSSFTEIGTSTSTSYADTTVAPSSAYSYRVRAEDAAGNRSGYSNTASATTPAASTAPAEPLPILDSFDRRNENPLSDSGRWTNGIGGSAEVGLRVVSRSVLACTKSTICSAWRNDASYGPDSEVWATISTLPGDGNELRLYARLQGAGASTYDGYLLRASQLPGTDELYLERVDDGTALTLLTLSRELAVGDVLLLRVSGSTLEAWLRRGASWSLVGSVASSTYPGAGLIGVGMSGTTGRLDDFGGR